MTSVIPAPVREIIEDKFGSIKSFSPASGGCINHGGRLEVKTRSVFLKWNDALKFPGMFAAEAKGLQMLYQSDCVKVPFVLLHTNVDEHQVIAMEWIEQSRRDASYWETLGRSLASLHRQTAKQFGLEHDNYIGSLLQRNRWTGDWSEFFVCERLEPQLQLLNATPRLRRRFESLFSKLPGIFPREHPSLLHGDLWSGNLITDKNGNPCLIDPAIYFGHREMELAFTRLFGGFDARFYDTYKEVFPLEAGFEERVDICNLYPLLVHANLFGGHYQDEIENILNRWT